MRWGNEKSVGRNSISWLWKPYEAWFCYAVAGYEWNDEHLQVTKGTVSILFQVLEAYGLTEEQKVHIVRMLRGFLQGFSAIESHGGYGNPTSLDDTFDFALKTILNGIRDLQVGTT